MHHQRYVHVYMRHLRNKSNLGYLSNKFAIFDNFVSSIMILVDLI